MPLSLPVFQHATDNCYRTYRRRVTCFARVHRPVRNLTITERRSNVISQPYKQFRSCSTLGSLHRLRRNMESLRVTRERNALQTALKELKRTQVQELCQVKMLFAIECAALNADSLDVSHRYITSPTLSALRLLWMLSL